MEKASEVVKPLHEYCTVLIISNSSEVIMLMRRIGVLQEEFKAVQLCGP